MGNITKAFGHCSNMVPSFLLASYGFLLQAFRKYHDEFSHKNTMNMVICMESTHKKQTLNIQMPPEVRCFRYILQVQIPPEKVF